MSQLIIVTSKYLISAMLVVFVITSVILLFIQGRKKICSMLYYLQIALIIACHFVGFHTLATKFDDIKLYYIYATELILIFAMIVFFRLIYPKCSRFLLNLMCMMFTIGSIILARLSIDKAIRQFVIAIISFLIALIIPYIIKKFKSIKEWWLLYATLGISVLALVLVVGSVTYGSKISFHILRISFQPSELIKIVFVAFLACILSRPYKFINIIIATIGASLHIVILVLSRDLGSSLIYYFAFMIMVYVATKKIWMLLAGSGVLVASSYVAYNLFSHVQIRVSAWKNPWLDLDDTGYQITQSLFAIGTGGLFGLGLGEGTPASIPLASKDFIFSAISEEMGAISAICLVFIILICFLWMLYISSILEDKFYSLVVLGIGITYVFQAFLTIGGGIKFIPLTGVALPFISYGGTSVMTTMFMFALVQGIYIYCIDNKKGKKRKRVVRKIKA